MSNITDPIDENPIAGARGHTDHHKKLAKKANALGKLVTDGYLAKGAIVPNTPEGRTALAGSPELSAAMGNQASTPGTPLETALTTKYAAASAVNAINARTVKRAHVGWPDGSTGTYVSGVGFNTVPILGASPDWDTGTFEFIVPETGRYEVVGLVRPIDNAATGINLGLAVYFGGNAVEGQARAQWHTPGAGRATITTVILQELAAGDRVKMVLFAPSEIAINYAELAVARF